MKIDALFTNGRFWTGDAGHPEATILAVHRGRILAVDDIDGLEAREVHDLGGARVIPGLHDAHHHLSFTGHRLAMVDLRGVTSVETVYARLAERAAQLPADAWVKATGYDQNLLGGQHPTAEAVDRAVGGRPAIVEHVSAHMLVANTRAFELAGFPDRRFPDIDGGRVFRDAAGRAEGLLQERAPWTRSGRSPPTSRSTTRWRRSSSPRTRPSPTASRASPSPASSPPAR
ncbi:amidohydrolase family protein [Sinomonas mesophila]|uniref:amidohydrolase family protein n=1 Tax=Sinomonas mesophila TaxID=1531955 RepID=UPI001FEADB78|nr:amidohydrolase family protein [Sinomonas mesophila]